jgi:hypothetical protein
MSRMKIAAATLCLPIVVTAVVSSAEDIELRDLDLRAVSADRYVKYWEIIADNLSKAGWSWGCVAAVDSNGRTIWIADTHRGNGKRFVVRTDEKLTAFLELERITHELAVSALLGDDSH